MSELNLVTASAQDIVRALQAGGTTSVKLVERYLDAIKKDNIEGKGLHAVIETVSREKLLARAKELDDERAKGEVRGLMHGVPVLVKDSFDLDYEEFGIRSTAGTMSLLSARPRKNADVVQLLIDGGAIILGTTNLSVMSCGMGPPQPMGWSPRGGQTVSAFGPDLHVASSSSGSAVAASAGFCAVAIGSETCASINTPANCAGLYAMKVTPGLISTRGAMPISLRQDSPGPMGKSPWDLAAVLSCIAKPEKPIDYTGAVDTGRSKQIGDFRIAIAQSSRVQGLKAHETALMDESRKIYDDLMAKLGSACHELHCPVLDELHAWYDPFGFGSDPPTVDAMDITDDVGGIGTFAESVNAYLAGLGNTDIKTLDALVDWHRANPELAFHPNAKGHIDPQINLSRSVMVFHEKDKYAKTMEDIRAKFAVWREQLIGFMDEHKLDLIAIPAGVLDMVGPALGAPTLLPVGSIPVGQLSNGAPVGLFVLGRPNAETMLLSFMACAEKVIPPRPVPNMS